MSHPIFEAVQTSDFEQVVFCQEKQSGGSRVVSQLLSDGAVELLLTQMARYLGARVIGTTSTPEKARLAYEVIVYTQADVEQEVQRLTKGERVAVVYDSVGKTTFQQSINCLRSRGYLVLYGQSSGQVPPFEPGRLASKSLFLTRPVLFDYISDRQSLLMRA